MFLKGKRQVFWFDNQLHQVWQTKAFSTGTWVRKRLERELAIGLGRMVKEEGKLNIESKESRIISIIMNFVYR